MDRNEDHQINRNVDEDSLNNNEETENTNLNDDVIGANVSSQGESSSGSDDVSRKRTLNPLEQNFVGHIQNADGETVPVIFAGSQIPPSIDRYVNSGLDAKFSSSGSVAGVAVSPIVQKGRFSIFDMAPIRGESDNVSDQEDDMEVDRDQVGGWMPKDAKKSKK